MKKLFFLLNLIGLFTTIYAQNPDMETTQDTTYQKRSRFTIGVAYDSKVLSAGRDFGTSQYGIFPTIRYYHKSGFYGRVGGNLLSDSVLTYTLTILSAGFQFDITSNWLADLSYDYLVYPNTDNNILNHGVNLYTDYTFGIISAGVSGSIFLGEETGYRLNTFLAAYFDIGKAGFFDNITFAPATSFLFGTENITLTRLTTRQFQRNLGVKWEERLKRRFPNQVIREEKQVFGLMCWNVDAPVYFKKGLITFGIIPTLVIPFELPGENEENLQSTFYGSASMKLSF